MAKDRLGIGFIGAGFVAQFHIRSLLAVRDADVAAVMSRTRAHAEEAAALARDLGVGAALRGIACEKPLARTVAEGRTMLALVRKAGLLHGYLENQLFSPAVMRG